MPSEASNFNNLDIYANLILTSCDYYIEKTGLNETYPLLSWDEMKTYCNYCREYGICFNRQELEVTNIGLFATALINVFSLLVASMMSMLGLYFLIDKKFK